MPSDRRSGALRAALVVALCSIVIGGAVPSALAEDGGLVVIEAARVITVSGEEFAPGQVVIEDGKVTLVGQNLDVPRSARRIRAGGETVMPGLVLARTRFGLPGYPRSGIHCDARVLDEIHADELDGRPLLRAGFVAAAYVPSGSGFPGQAAVVRPPHDGEAEVLREAAYLPVSMVSNSRDRRVIEQAFDRARKEIEKAVKAEEEWKKKQEEAKKKAEAEAKKNGDSGGGKAADPPEKGGKSEEKKEPEKFTPPPIPAEIAPLVSILRKEDSALPLLFELSDAGNLLHLDEVLEGIEEARGERHRNVQFEPSSRQEQRPMLATLGERGATIVTAPLLSNRPYTFTLLNLPAEAADAGARLVFIPRSDSETEFRMLRSRVADLVRAGLSREEGLRALTVNPADFLGLGDRLGSIEKGRSADLVFLDGDPLAAGTRVTRTMIAGDWVWEEEE